MTVVTIGRKLVPLAQVALLEVFDRAANPEFKPEKDYKARLILLNREIPATMKALLRVTPSSRVTLGFSAADWDMALSMACD